MPTSIITGVVLLQGRTVHAGTNIFLTEGPCPDFPSGPPAAVTNETGYFEITPVSGRTYQCLQAFQLGYLVCQREAPQGSLGNITLPAGDVTRDDAIDIFDLALIAGHYRSTNPMADLNSDGQVDVLDLSMVSGNYNQRGPVSNWQ
jgi:hypothetical protein